MTGGDVEHFAETEGAADRAAADGALAGDEREGVNGDGGWRHPDEPEGSIWAQGLR